MIPIVLSIAGSDSGGGAGIQADIKTIQANGGYAATVVTAVTAQNSVAVTDSIDIPVSLIEAQIDAVCTDMQVAAIKTGMLSSVEIVESIAAKLKSYDIHPLVVDPVMVSKSGFALLKEDAVEAVVRRLFPLADLVTPNAEEASILVGGDVKTIADAKDAAVTIHAMGPQAVLVKGGHLDSGSEAVDILYDGDSFVVYRKDRIDTTNTHGTGCTYASAICTNMAFGIGLEESVRLAKEYVTDAIKAALPIGQGHGPLDHFFRQRKG